MTTPEREAAASIAIDEQGKKTRSSFTQEEREQFAFWRLLRMLARWKTTPNHFIAGTLRVALFAVDRERMEAEQRERDAVDAWRDEDVGSDASVVMELIEASDARRKLTKAEE